jgi:hypothetical protein
MPFSQIVRAVEFTKVGPLATFLLKILGELEESYHQMPMVQLAYPVEEG